MRRFSKERKLKGEGVQMRRSSNEKKFK